MASTPALPAGPAGSGTADAALGSGDRWVASLLLLVISGTHLALVPEHLEEAPYAGYLFLALGIVGIGLAAVVVLRERPLLWLASALLAATTVAAYVLSRTLGLPELGDDVGNWTEPLSFPAVAAEVMLVGVALSVWVRRRSPAR